MCSSLRWVVSRTEAPAEDSRPDNPPMLSHRASAQFTSHQPPACHDNPIIFSYLKKPPLRGVHVARSNAKCWSNLLSACVIFFFPLFFAVDCTRRPYRPGRGVSEARHGRLPGQQQKQRQQQNQTSRASEVVVEPAGSVTRACCLVALLLCLLLLVAVVVVAAASSVN